MPTLELRKLWRSLFFCMVRHPPSWSTPTRSLFHPTGRPDPPLPARALASDPHAHVPCPRHRASQWLADKAPVQNDLAHKLGALVHCFDTPEAVALWIEVMGRTLREEWHKLDKYRVDKYYMLIRQALHEVFAWLAVTEWERRSVETVAAAG